MSDYLEKFMDDVERRLAAVESCLDLDTTAGPSAGSCNNAEVVENFEAFLETLTPFLKSSKGLDEKLSAMCQDFAKCFDETLELLKTAGRSKQPSKDKLAQLYEPLLAATAQLRKHRLARDFINHEKALLEAAGAVMWLNDTVPSPLGFAESMRDASVFYANKVRVEYKGKSSGKNHIKWCDQLNDVLQSLCDFIKENQKYGLTWNAAGGSAESTSKPVPQSKPNVAAKPKPAAKPKGGGNVADVFAELSKIDQSQGKTAGLRHVSDDMKSKNLKDKSRVVPSKKTATKPKKSSVVAKKSDPVMELRGLKWVIEHQTDGAIQILEADQLGIKRTVYIYKCNNATIVLKGKCNNVTLDSCDKTQLLFDNVLGSCEVVNCRSVKVQCNVTAPTVSIDKSDGVTIYVMDRKVVQDLRFVTSKSSEMNVSWPSSNPDDGFVEKPIPEQFVSVVQADDTVTTSVSDLYSH